MMVGIRSGASIQARPHIPDGESIQEHDFEAESSDDDNEEIPNTSTPKSRVDPSIRSLDHRRGRSLQLADEPSLRILQSKRRKLGSTARLQGALPYPIAASVSITQHPKSTTSRKRSRNSSPEDTVPRGLVSAVNAALKKNGYGASQQHIAAPNAQSNSTLSRQSHGDLQAEFDHETIPAQGPHGHRETATPERDRSPSLFVSEQEDGHQSDGTLASGNDAEEDTARDERPNVWDVPVSPGPPPPSQRGSARSLRYLSRRGGRVEAHRALRRSKPSRSSPSNQAQATEQRQPTKEADHITSSALTQPDVEVDPQQEEREDCEDEHAMEQFGPSPTDDENISDVDLSAEESFAQDIAHFRVRFPEGYKDGETFDAPPEDDDAVIHIDHSGLKMALRLMGHSAWAGVRSTVYRRSFDFKSADTEPVRTLLELLGKLDRLLGAAPKAPLILEQNKFLNEHSDVLDYYLSNVRLVLRRLRRRLKEGPNRSRPNADTKERNKVSKEVVSLAIPMTFHVLASAWNLGGDDWRRTAFTVSIVELLMRALGWAELLYRPLLRELEQTPVGESVDESANWKRAQWVKREKIEELDKHLQNLRGAIESAPDELLREERRRIRAYLGLRHNPERQEEMKDQWKREEEEMMRSVKERQRRSVMSIRGVHTPLSESSIPPSSTRSSLARRASSHISTRAQSQAPQPPQNADDWSLEEKTFLFKEIQVSYPNLLDLDDVRWSLNRTLEETEAKAEEILGLMLEAVHPEQAKAERDAHIEEVMQVYRRTWGHAKS
ncbi:hypothetical protein F5Y05DRAFT_372960 [Hypoxylon sp. FL0543]|nr:hypothetical protein F5Y05DRAFT_372960 [Hypoxylon sp. FL0543]